MHAPTINGDDTSFTAYLVMECSILSRLYLSLVGSWSTSMPTSKRPLPTERSFAFLHGLSVNLNKIKHGHLIHIELFFAPGRWQSVVRDLRFGPVLTLRRYQVPILITSLIYKQLATRAAPYPLPPMNNSLAVEERIYRGDADRCHGQCGC